ncbi:universal stress protein [Aquisalimonas sp.]|uniref:universal stress protein n=1 Tax=Aquisalimonas sp. TaxID=1872621 RepID=UPI0025B8C109|nr:universal stress protein [Aquisalimonas sp.]
MNQNTFYSRILLPVDGSETAKRARRAAADLSRMSGQPITVLSVIVDRDIMPSELMGPGKISTKDIQESRRREAQATVKAAADALREQGLTVDEEILVGDPAQEIIQRTREVDAPVVVIGRRGLTGFRELVMGSVSNKVVHYAECPVLVIN